jgi:hypothetical protein
MKRIAMVVMVAAIMATILATSALPAIAQDVGDYAPYDETAAPYLEDDVNYGGTPDLYGLYLEAQYDVPSTCTDTPGELFGCPPSAAIPSMRAAKFMDLLCQEYGYGYYDETQSQCETVH